MCYRPEIFLQCCNRYVPWGSASLSANLYTGSWQPPIVELCVYPGWEIVATGLVYLGECPRKLWKLYPSAAWSTCPAACPECEEKCIQNANKAAEALAPLEATFKNFEGPPRRAALDAQILRRAKRFFDGAFRKRARQGDYAQWALGRVQLWMRLLGEKGLELGQQYQPTNGPPPAINLGLETLGDEMAALQPQICADTVELVELLLRQMLLYETNRAAELLTVSAAIGDLRAKYFDSPGEEMEHSSNASLHHDVELEVAS